MGYPGQKYRQQQASMPVPTNSQNYGPPPPQNYNQDYSSYPSQGQVYNQGYGSFHNQNFNQQHNAPNQGYNQANPNFPQPNPGFPSGGMPIPEVNMPMPNLNNPPPYTGYPHVNSYNQPNVPQPAHNSHYQGMVPPSPSFTTAEFASLGQQHTFNPPPQPPPQNQVRFNQPPPIQQAPHSQPLPPGASGSIPVSNFSGRKKALLIGINYFHTNAELKGCINDVRNVRDFICQNYSFSTESMVILTDDQKHDISRMPTRANIIQAMKWLVSDARPNDSLFFHFSGHGSQQEDTDGDEDDGFDETICPVDFNKAGMIVDDEMNLIMVQPLPPGCRLTAIFDCCHSGTALDLPYTYDKHGKLKSYSPAKTVTKVAIDLGKKYLMGDMVGALMSLKNGVSSLKTGKKAEKVTQETRGSMADVIMFSGCEDSQTSADAVEQGVGNTGAMSFALIKVLSNNPHNLSYLQILTQVRGILQGKYTQVPQLSSGRPMDMSTCFSM